MTATDRLRALLDERGVEWHETVDGTTHWRNVDGSLYWAREGFTFDGPNGKVTAFNLTPEQAVEATLGKGTCRVVSARIIDHGEDRYETELSCGHVVHLPPEDFDWCPNCGRMVSQGEEEG